MLAQRKGLGEPISALVLDVGTERSVLGTQLLNEPLECASGLQLHGLSHRLALAGLDHPEEGRGTGRRVADELVLDAESHGRAGR